MMLRCNGSALVVLSSLLSTRHASLWWLLVAFMLVTTTVIKAGDYNYTTNSDGTLTITRYTGPGGDVVIPSVIDGRTVTSFGVGAFERNASLTNVVIPDSVTNIGHYAFFDDINLMAITIGKGVTSIGLYAFAGCESLRSVVIPDSVISIGTEAFANCYSLTNVMIGIGLTSIEGVVFAYDHNLTTIMVAGGNSVYSSVDGVLFNKSQTTLVVYPGGKAGSYTIPDSVTSIANWAFYISSGLTSVTISDSVTRIGDHAFSTSRNLTNVMIGKSVTNIGDSAFAGCSNLSSVTIGSGVINIEFDAFVLCNLTSVIIPDSVINIGGEAFSHNPNLTYVVIGKSVTSIEGSAFRECPSLIGVYFMGNAPLVITSAFDSDNLATVYYLPGTTGWGWTFVGGRPAMPWWDGPQIYANGAREDVTLNSGEPVKITVAAAANSLADAPLDWWIIARANVNSSIGYLYRNNSGQWTQFDGSLSNCRPVYQGSLFNLPSTEVLNTRDLQPGSYSFWFAIDYPMDGILNLGGYILMDSVNITVR